MINPLLPLVRLYRYCISPTLPPACATRQALHGGEEIEVGVRLLHGELVERVTVGGASGERGAGGIHERRRYADSWGSGRRGT